MYIDVMQLWLSVLIKTYSGTTIWLDVGDLFMIFLGDALAIFKLLEHIYNTICF